MKNFITHLNREFQKYKSSNEDKKLLFPPMINGEKVDGVTGLYLCLYATNRKLDTSFISINNISTENINSTKSMELESVKVITSYDINNSVMCFKNVIQNYIPEYDFDNPKQEDIDQVRKLINEKKIHARAISGNFKKIEGIVCSVPVRNYSFTEEECVNTDFLQNLKKLPRQVVDLDTFDREKAENILSDLDNSLLKELVIFNFSVEQDKLIDLSVLKAIESLNGIFSMNSDTFQIMNIVREDFENINTPKNKAILFK